MTCKTLFAIGTAIVFLAGCATPPQPICPELPAVTAIQPKPTPIPVVARFERVNWQDIAGWPGEGMLAAWPAWLQSCRKIAHKPGWQGACTEAVALKPRSDDAIRQFFEARFDPWQISSSEPSGNTGLITGYYEPLLTGSRTNGNGRYPIYAPPDDLLTIDLADLYPELKNLHLRGRLVGNKVVPYWNRTDIDAGKAPVAGKVLAWADDPIELFFLQIQGSGRIKLEDGSLFRVGYADQNGQPYKSVGKWLIDKGELKASEASMQGIQTWANAHPDRLKELLNSNPSYVFFKEIANPTGGPQGAMGLPLTDAVSVAIDNRYVPLGVPLFLSTTWPGDSAKPLQRLVMAQDTGGAIRGPVRVDYFWGFGPEAGMLAGRMKQKGQVWMIWPKDAPAPAGDNKNSAQ